MINNYENEINEIMRKLENLKSYINEKQKIINEEKQRIKEFKKNLNKNLYDNKEKINKLIDELKINEKKIYELKSNFPVLLKDGEKLIPVIFISADENILYSIICKNTDNFSIIENLIYNKYPCYKNENNIFIINGQTINKNKNLEYNNIKYSDIIEIKTNN